MTSITTGEFRQSLQNRLSDVLDTYAAKAQRISPAAIEMVTEVAALSSQGKRLRALLAWLGWRGLGGAADDPRILDAAVSLELFQSAALIHDDIIDRSDTRRAAPSLHKKFENLHASQQWGEDGAHFGVSAGILAGDLALALSEEVFAQAADSTAYAAAARSAFNEMRFEVMIGQYLDLRSEVDAGSEITTADALHKARTVLQYKSAHYSSVWPLEIGAVLAGSDETTAQNLREFSLPLGIAFQLQDDILGVFGNPDATGKPAGDDLREGKRTELIAHAIDLLDEQDQTRLEAALGDPELSEQQISTLQDLLISCGAREKVEAEIGRLGQQAFAALDELKLDGDVVTELRELTESLLHRQS